MIIVPIATEPDRCPRCDKLEDIKQVCTHCGYEYKDEDEGIFWKGILLIIFLTIVGVWLFLTGGYWLMEQTGYRPNKPTFFEVLQGQWEFIRGLKLW